MPDPSPAEKSNAVVPPPQVGGGVVVSRRMLIFDPASGMPVPMDVPCLTKPQLENLAGAALSLPYEPEEPEEPDYDTFSTEGAKAAAQAHYEKDVERYQAEKTKFAGMSCAEVMMVKRAQSAASGDAGAMDAMLDRAIGKPKQSSESFIKTMKYEDYLKKMADDEAMGRGAIDVDVSDADVNPPPFDPPPPDEFPGLRNIL